MNYIKVKIVKENWKLENEMKGVIYYQVPKQCQLQPENSSLKTVVQIQRPNGSKSE